MLQFVRETSILIKIEKAPSERRGFLIHLAAGFTGQLDPQSGMIVNLVEVDRALLDLKNQLESAPAKPAKDAAEASTNSVFATLHAQAADFLNRQMRPFDVQLASLRFREERGFGFGSYRVPVVAGDLEFFNSHYLELVPPEGSTSLIKVTLYWQHRADCAAADYAHEGFKLLKPLMMLNAADILSQLTPLKGTRLPSGSFLNRIEVTNLALNQTLEI